jgi:MoaA/NifB/PqqE/SkfB family radical SAM enzyme
VTPPLVLIPQHFGSLIFDRRTSRYLPFDHEATAVLRGGIGSACSERAQDFYEAFERRGFFTLDGRLAGTVIDATPPADHLLGPLAVHLELLAACNLACAHCFAGVLPRRGKPLDLVEMDRLFGELAAIGSFRLGLTGGEPLMRRDLLEIIDAATGRGLHPCLTTNALLVDERMARELGRRPLVWLNVSLDGATAATNDAIRGAGVFDRVVEKLRLLGRHARFTLAFTITRESAREVEACARLARELGAHTAVFRPLYPVGVARDRLDLMPTFDEYADALERLGDQADVDGIDPFSPQASAGTQPKIHGNEGCGAGNLIATVSATGQVNPCSFLGSAFDAASVREQPFAAIWNDHPVFVAMRARSGEAFAGGCRARSLAYRGDAGAADPWHDAWKRRGGDAHPTANLEVGGD